MLESLSLGYDHIRWENRSIGYWSVTGFGRGAGAKLLGYDLAVEALAGLMSISGSAEGEPHKVGVALVDVLAGRNSQDFGGVTAPVKASGSTSICSPLCS